VLLLKVGIKLVQTEQVGFDVKQVKVCADHTVLDLSFPAEFGIAHEINTPEGNKDEWIVGFVNAAPYIASALL
jgi:hypothetical protein